MSTMFGKIALRSGLRSQNGNQKYADFLNGGRTAHGRTFNQIMAYNDNELESDHSFIQWIFPLPDPSQFNPDAPLVDISYSLHNAVAQEKIMSSFHLLRTFWGIGDEIDKRRLRCLNGHNGLRFSRALQALVYHNREAQAREMLEKVLSIMGDLRPTMFDETTTMWEHAFQSAVAHVAQIKAVDQGSIVARGR